MATRLLLAEDTRDLNRALTTVLEHEGYEVCPVFDGEEALLRQHAVQRRGGVALAQHQAVAVGVLGIPGIHVHLGEIDGGEYLGDGQGSARMSGLALVQRLDQVDPELVAQLFKPGLFFHG